MPEESKKPVIEIDNLKVHFHVREGIVKAVDGVSLSLMPGEVLGVVGESGSGKSITVRALMQLLPKSGKIADGRILFNGDAGKVTDIAKLDRQSREMRALRGGRIGMIFQEPMTALSPVHTIGHQVMTPILLHSQGGKREAGKRAREVLDMVRLPRIDEMMRSYPHQLSGGMRQRAMIAIALACRPQVLIADEPTTALDVTTEAQILDLLKELKAELGMSIIFITHNFGVVADIADRVSVMYLGNVVETGRTEDIFYDPQHPYTKALLNSIPRLGAAKQHRLNTIPGMIPDPFNLPGGCVFHPRCGLASHEDCRRIYPPITRIDDQRTARCHVVAEAIKARNLETGSAV
ncbi:ABC transporter ATP-binding protein [Allorhizobium taibaishanense]|uniref:Dipeptide/oligopeptide/nickel ABC transporter ATP-binding protein n=1 Tax=Allorhizobium taibaishanense TaxID=887144 RepID=A0A1Q9A6Y5_9HYPH|nr:ABC transporter ATP-binding protein [Allorhizobium taibaishanense]MBB4008555.1 peptide/nickel transport system ATP-binding protein [Allorhizobium taibaishanense]OLP50294.1 dipeptide/oligopeptide/nickel ABC transporter ATP-binding protein [Allorhizobium taibaishanense]